VALSPRDGFYFCRRLFSNDDDGEGAGLHFAAALAGGWRFEFGAGEKNFVRFQIEAQGAGGLFCRDIFDDGEFVGRVLVDDGQIAVAAGDEEQVVRRIKRGGVGAVADGGVGDDFAGIGVDDRGNFIVADGDQAAVLEITGEAGGRFARGKRPAMQFLQVLRVEMA